MPAAAFPESAASKSEGKSKKERRSKSEKKRVRDEDAAAEGERKHKKSKRTSADAVAPDEDLASSRDVNRGEEEADEEEKKKKKKKKKSSKNDGQLKLEGDDVDHQVTATASPSKKSKRKNAKEEQHSSQMGETAGSNTGDAKPDKKEKRRKKKTEVETSHDDHVQPEARLAQADARSEDAMDLDEPSSHMAPPGVYQPSDIPANPQFPFFRQKISLYKPIYPSGWAQPVSSAQDQHLQQLQNKYVPSLRGVLLDYTNVSLGPEPGHDGAAADDESPTTLLSKGEYAVGFGWITADVGLFVPSRGAWMEGSVNLQTEGHIGVVCFGKFNASIEASRLPPSWKWVSNESPEANGFEETASVITADDHGVVRQIHSTGFWVDGSGSRIKGRVRFRIRNFDAGASGETSYLSLEGTMLDRESEKKLLREEARLAQVRREKKDGRKAERRRAPDFSMTHFVPEEEESQRDAAAAAAVAPVEEASNMVKFDD